MGRALPFLFGRTTGDQGSPVAGEKPDDSGCKHPSPPVFSRAVDASGDANKAINAICVYLRDLRFLLGGWAAS